MRHRRPNRWLPAAVLAIFSALVAYRAWRAQDAVPQMPETFRSTAALSELYLTPAGKYTAADIDANGRQTAGQKYASFRARHDFDPQPGDAVCPITRTKASAACTWIVAGHKYEFCCPPCIDEFVQLAKERPEEVELPDRYVKQ